MAFSLLFGGFVVPARAEAGLLSSIFGTEVSASAEIPSKPGNSQNIALLESNVSTLAMIEDKKDKKTATNEIEQGVDVNIVSENALLPAISPVSATDGIGGGDFSFEEGVDIYVVRSGDTVAGIAEIFEITSDTIYSLNEKKKGDKVKEGDVLLIPNFSGVEHTVTSGQTLQGIANLYKVSIDDIISANDIGEGAKIVVGEKLMIPEGHILNETKPKTSSGIARGSSNIPSVDGYFINPVPGSVKSRGVKKGHAGVDFAAPTGTPILAAASGKILKASLGWNGGYGNMVVIGHPNGTTTLYAHMSKIIATTGAQVAQGDTIGAVGSTGKSTGSHTHFEVKNARNPF